MGNHVAPDIWNIPSANERLSVRPFLTAGTSCASNLKNLSIVFSRLEVKVKAKVTFTEGCWKEIHLYQEITIKHKIIKPCTLNLRGEIMIPNCLIAKDTKGVKFQLNRVLFEIVTLNIFLDAIQICYNSKLFAMRKLLELHYHPTPNKHCQIFSKSEIFLLQVCLHDVSLCNTFVHLLVGS